MAYRTKDTRISVPLGDEELFEDVERIAGQLRSSKGGVGVLALQFVIPRIKSGEFAVLNGAIVPAERKGK
jgi:hypothetical protein